MKFLRGSERVPERHLHRGEPWTAPRALTAASRAGRPWGHVFTVREEDYVILNLDFYRAVRGGPHPAPGGPPEDHERKRRAFPRTAEGDRILSPREKHKGGQKLQERRELRERNVGAVSAPRGPSGMNRPAEGGGQGGGKPLAWAVERPSLSRACHGGPRPRRLWSRRHRLRFHGNAGLAAGFALCIQRIVPAETGRLKHGCKQSKGSTDSG